MSDCELYADISPWWPTDAAGLERSVRSVAIELRNKANIHLPEKTIGEAKKGDRLKQGNFLYLKRLADLCSFYAGKKVTIEEILRSQ